MQAGMEHDRRRRSSSPSLGASGSQASIGKRTLTQRHVQRAPRWPQVQLARDAHTGLDDHDVTTAASHGIAGGGGELPHLGAIQRSFGDHDVSDVQAHVGGPAAEASEALGAHAYATGNDVAFASQPSLFLAAHEAAHVVQQRSGVHLSSAVGHAGDSYEHNADAVAARVVAGESAADLLGPVRAGGATGVQRAPNANFGMGVPDVDFDAKPPKASPLDRGLALASAAIPVIKAGMEVIEGIKGVWDLVQGGSGASADQLPGEVTPFNHEQLERVYRHEIAKAFVRRVMTAGLKHGVDFGIWLDGRPSFDPSLVTDAGKQLRKGLPADTAADATAALAAAGVAPATTAADAASTPAATPAAAPAAVPAADPLPPGVAELIKELQGIAAKDTESDAKQSVHKLIMDNVSIAPVSWWWNGNGEHGFGEAPLGIGGAATWGQLTFYVSVARVPDGQKVGVPAEAYHFGIDPTEKPVKHLLWFKGGRVEVRTEEGSFDDLSVKQTERSSRDSENAPVGAHHLAYMFQWDNNATSVDFDLTVDADLMQAKLRNIKPSDKKPRT